MKKEQKKMKKLIRVLKNIYLSSVVNCLIQASLNSVIWEILGQFLVNVSYQKKWMATFTMGIFFVIFNELLLRRWVERKVSKSLIINGFCLEVVFGITRLFAFLKIFIRPKKNLFASSEKEVDRFVQNLTVERILEKKEARLVSKAMAFDEWQAQDFATEWERVIYLTTNLTFPEIQQIYRANFRSNYPVLNEKEELVGVFNYQVFNWIRFQEKFAAWQDYIVEEVSVAPTTKLSQVFSKLQQRNSALAIIQEEGKIRGIITERDILGTLVGKMYDEREQLASDYQHYP